MVAGIGQHVTLVQQTYEGGTFDYGANLGVQNGGGKRKTRTNRKKRTRTRRSKGIRTRDCECRTCECNPCKCKRKKSKAGSKKRKTLASFRAALRI